MSYWQIFKTEIIETKSFFLNLLIHPVISVRTLPDWKWPTLAFTHLLISVASGFLTGILSASFIHMIVGLFLFPLSSFLAMLIAGAFLYYSLLIFFEKTV